MKQAILLTILVSAAMSAQELPKLKKTCAEPNGNAKELLAFAMKALDKQDADLAVCYISRSAQAGNSEAQLNLGGLYWAGEGVPKNRDQAVLWWKKSAAAGNLKAQRALDRYVPKLTPAQEFGLLLVMEALFGDNSSPPPRSSSHSRRDGPDGLYHAGIYNSAAEEQADNYRRRDEREYQERQAQKEERKNDPPE